MVPVGLAGWGRLPPSPGKGNAPGVPLTSAEIRAARAALTLSPWALVMVPALTAASILAVASLLSVVITVCGAMFFDWATEAMLWPDLRSAFSSAGVMPNAVAAACSEAPARPGPSGPPLRPGCGLAPGEAVAEGDVVWARETPGTPNATP